MDIGSHFSDRAAEYDYRRADVVPGFHSFYRTFTDLASPGLTLDLGAGTGILSRRLADTGHEVVSLDLSPAMLAEARKKGLRDTVLADMRSLPLSPGFDTVVSSLAIHHLSTEEKRELYREVHSSLRPRGLFLHGDMVRAPTDALQERYMAIWEGYMRERGLGDRAARCIEDAETHDVYEPLRDHLDWLRDTGFIDVDVHWKRYNFAVFGGRKPE